MLVIDPPKPDNELARLEKLRSYGILDTPADIFFNGLTTLGARHFDVPICLVSLVDEGRQWFKSHHGLTIDQTPRRLSFCAHAILRNDVMVVTDATLDERFAENDLVTGAPRIRFYAGAPIKTSDGFCLGTFCIIDRIPRSNFDERAAQDLKEFANLVIQQMETGAAKVILERIAGEREDALHRQQESVRLLEAILESVKDPIFVKDVEGRYITVNTVSAGILGLSPDEVIGRTDEDLFPPEIAAHLSRLDRQVIETTLPVTEQQSLLDFSTGEPLTFETVKTPLRGAGGAVIGLVGIARDVTDRRRAEQALRSSEERLRMLVENAPQPMWVNRPDGTLEQHNRAWRIYTGLTTDEASRMHALHPEDLDHVLTVRTAALPMGQPYEFEARIRRADGAYRRNMVRVHPLVQDDQIVAWIGMAIDIDDIHRGREAAEEASRSKTRFLAAASHDLRQPVQSALLFLDGVAAHVRDEVGRSALKGLDSSLDALKWMLDGLLDVSRLDAGIVTTQVKTVSVAEVLTQAAHAFAPMAAAKGLRLQVRPCDVQVRSDPVLLGRILRNLLENAVRYTEKGDIALLCAERGDHLTIQVQDTGIGIPPDQLDRIFEEFYQVGNSERDRSQGLGLGLAIVKRLADLLDHPIEVQSTPGSGTVFTIRVPHVAAEKTDQPLSEPPDPSSRAEQQPFAVIIDDDAFVLLALQTIVKRWGFQVLAAGATDDAVERLRQEGRRPDVLLVDYRLREGRVGTEAVKRIREMFGSDVPAAIITGEIGPEPQRDAADLRLSLMQKPVMPCELTAVLSDLLGKPVGDDAVRS
ncbi:PAS domain S-box protein [Azospirillum sp. SYSU D00513]|uniref:hybrid sensor histidine kinase/response regulator n=1 Tax=Azospirillum sp. SYSU D00513 TaxID=2812561 RepID=UPI001A973845|nr:PAS domain S-box protein [Azospirillum sp. SYSU D00513]